MQNHRVKKNLKIMTNTFSKSNSPSISIQTPKSAKLPQANIYHPTNNFAPLYQSSKLDKLMNNFSSRASGRLISTSPSHEKNSLNNVQVMEKIVKEELKMLSFREKLLNIEALIKNCRELCQNFGYFYITYAMVFYDPYSQVRLSIWIHPDLRSTRPLHPINKPNLKDCQTQFILHFKKQLKNFFPTISLGSGQTFTHLLDNIHELKSKLFQKNKQTKLKGGKEIYLDLEKTQKKIWISQYDSNCSTTRNKEPNLQGEFAEEEDNQKMKLTKLKETKSCQNYKDLLSLAKSIPVKKISGFDQHEQRIQNLKFSTTKVEKQLNSLFQSNISEHLYNKEHSRSNSKFSFIEQITNQFNEIL